MNRSLRTTKSINGLVNFSNIAVLFFQCRTRCRISDWTIRCGWPPARSTRGPRKWRRRAPSSRRRSPSCPRKNVSTVFFSFQQQQQQQQQQQNNQTPTKPILESLARFLFFSLIPIAVCPESPRPKPSADSQDRATFHFNFQALLCGSGGRLSMNQRKKPDCDLIRFLARRIEFPFCCAAGLYLLFLFLLFFFFFATHHLGELRCVWTRRPRPMMDRPAGPLSFDPDSDGPGENSVEKKNSRYRKKKLIP